MSGDHHLQERRVSARRDSVNRALCGRSRVLFGDDRSDNQERRASARRGVRRTTTRCAVATAAYCCDDAYRTIDQERRVSARRGSQNRTLCGCNRAMFDDDRTDDQERRALARRGYRYR
jgi:hypothetical protein